MKYSLSLFGFLLLASLLAIMYFDNVEGQGQGRSVYMRPRDEPTPTPTPEPTPESTATPEPTPMPTSTPEYVTRGDAQGVGGEIMNDDDYYTTGQVLHAPAGEMAFESGYTPVPTPTGDTLRIVFRMSRPGPAGTPTPAVSYAHISRHGEHWLRVDDDTTYFLATPTPTPTVGAGTPTPTPHPYQYPYSYLLWTK